MNEYMQDPNYIYNGSAPDTGNGASEIIKGLKYSNIMLTVLLTAVLIAGIVGIIVLTNISKDVSKNTKAITDISKELSSVGDDVADICNTVDDILEQGCTGNNAANDPSDPYDPYDPWEYGVEKPVIYLYSDGDAAETHVELTLNGSDMVSMWPYADVDGNSYSWDVSVSPDGIISDADGNEYSYLFWEASGYGEHSFDKGFCVAGSDTADFLRGTLAEIGLSSKEANEFITYWLPRMQGNEYNLITFEGLDPSDAYNTDYSLSVRDAEGNEADSVLRVLMVWKAADEPEEIEAQEFDGFERSGFTVVEWGGVELTSRD